jgi:hypothetical protein
MKKRLDSVTAGIMVSFLLFIPAVLKGQNERAVIKEYLSELPKVKPDNGLSKYRMTAVYTNMDLYGKFTDKTKVTGDYTIGSAGDSAVWNNVYISTSNSYSEPFPAGTKQEYIEGFKYVPSEKMVTAKEAFKNFPSSPQNIFARNLIWDMYSFEIYTWLYYDSLKLNEQYMIPGAPGQFNMAEIGNYSHNKMMVRWSGITQLNNELCSVIDFTTIDNKLEINMDMIKTKGTEQYWGTVLVSQKTKTIKHAVMYSGTIQEIEVKGLKDKFLIKTIRELKVDKIQ